MSIIVIDDKQYLDKNIFIEVVENESHFELLESEVRDYTKDEYDFINCNMFEMIYYFIHKKNDLYDDKKDKTKKEYASILFYFYKDVLTHFDSIKELNRFHVEDYQQELTKTYEKNTVVKKNAIIRSFLYWLYEVGYIEKDITKGMKRIRVKQEEQPEKELTMGEVKTVIHSLKKEYIGDLALVFTLAFSGLRVFELAKAKFGDIIIEDTSGEYFLQTIGKGDKFAYVHINNEVYNILMAFRKRRGYTNNVKEEKDTPLYPNTRGAHYNPSYLSKKATDIVNKVLTLTDESNDRPLSAHSLRHAYAEILRDAGADLLEIQEALRHSDPRTTKRYLSRYQKLEKHAGKKIDVSKFI